MPKKKARQRTKKRGKHGTTKKAYTKRKASVAKVALPETRFSLKTPAEFQEMLALSTKLESEGAQVGACWFSDSGGTDQCVPLTEEECRSRGGTWTPGPCPN